MMMKQLNNRALKILSISGIILTICLLTMAFPVKVNAQVTDSKKKADTDSKQQESSDQKKLKIEKIYWIEPGRAVGPINIGQTDIGQVISDFKISKKLLDRKNGMLYGRKACGLDFMYNTKTLKVTSILISRPVFNKTAYNMSKTGISTHMPMRAALNAYGKPSKIEQLSKKYEIAVYHTKDRFAAFIALNGKIVQIWTGLKTDYDKHIKSMRQVFK